MGHRNLLWTGIMCLALWPHPSAAQSDHPNGALPPIDPTWAVDRVWFSFDSDGLVDAPWLVTANGVEIVDASNVERARAFPTGVTLSLAEGTLYGLAEKGDVQWDLDANGYLALVGAMGAVPSKWLTADAPVDANVLTLDGCSADVAAGGALAITVMESGIQTVDWTMHDAVLSVDASTATSGLKLSGSLTGKYTPSAMDLDARLDLVEPFEYESGGLSSTLEGGTATVHVERSEFKWAELSNVTVEAELDLEGNLELSGEIDSGRYDAGQGISFGATLELVEDFVYERGPVESTLQSGGTLTVGVRRDDLAQTELNVDLTIAASVGGDVLEVGGSVAKGKYEDGRVDFEASLELLQPFEYKKGKVENTLEPGVVEVKLRDTNAKPTLWVHQTGPPLVVDLGDDSDDEE